MKKTYLVILSMIFSLEAVAEEPSLTEMMLALDAEVFDSFNRCEDEKQLNKHASFFDPKVEFYHDNGGVTWSRDTMIENTKKYACGNFTRELVEGSFSAHPIKDFGAITQGVHRFCQSDTKQCEGEADFVMIWRNTKGKWEVTRTLSYGHRAKH